MTLNADIDQITQFVDAVFRHATAGTPEKPHFVSLRSFYDGSSKPFRITPLRLGNDPFPQAMIAEAAREAWLCAQQGKAVVFCPPLASFGSSREARERNVSEAYTLSVECDSRPREAREQLEGLLGATTITVASGGVCLNGSEPQDKLHLHLHWRLRTPVRAADDLAKLKRARKLAARLVGADPSNVPVVHPIRWPGSWHRKATPRLCRIVSLAADREIDLYAALAILEAAAPAPAPEPARDAHKAVQAEEKASAAWKTLLADISAGVNLHQSIAVCAAKMVTAGMNDGAIVNLLRAAMEISHAPRDERWRARYDDIPRAVSTAREKFGTGAAATTADAPLFDPWERVILPVFPLEILPERVEQHTREQAGIIGGDISGLAMAELAAFSGAINHQTSLKMMRHGGWFVHPRLWLLLVGDPSQGKTPILQAAIGPLVQYDAHLRRQYASVLHDYKAAKAEAGGNSKLQEPEPPPRFIIHDTTVEKAGELLARSPKGLLVVADEIAGWIGSMERYNNSGSRADRAFWLKAFDGGPYNIDRIRRGEIFVENLSVSIIGGIQPARLAEIHGLTSDGLLQRFIPVVLAPAKFPQDVECSDRAYGDLVRALVEDKPRHLIMTDAALAVMNRLRERLFSIERECSSLSSALQGFVGKLHGLCGSLALILHLAHHPQDGMHEIEVETIEAETIEDVTRLVIDFILPHAKEFYAGAASTSADRIRRMASWILTSGKTRVLASDLTSNVSDCRGLTLAQLNERVSPLVAAGWLSPAGMMPMPACQSWTVNPQVLQQFRERAVSEAQRKGVLKELMGVRGRIADPSPPAAGE